MAAPASAARQRWLRELLAYAVLLALMVWTLGPLYWMVITSIKTNPEIYGTTATFWPRRPTLANYRVLFTKTPFAVYFQNSALIALTTTAITVLASALGAYALVRLRFPGRRLLARVLVYTYLVPQSLLFIPLFTILVNAGLSNTRTGLVLTYLGFTVPFCTWLLMGYFLSVPVELEEAGLVDGCSRLGVLFRIVMPVTLPALAVTAFFSFTLSWNEYLYASVFVSDVNAKTIPTGIPSFIIEDVFFWGPMMASTVLSVIPPLAVYFLFQRWLITGLTLGAVKG
jgi:ABC-type glycerol-3-phosphate transport system permease component